MLERYLELHVTLTSAKTMTRPDPKTAASPSKAAANAHPGNSARHRQLAEFADIARCIQRAKLERLETALLREIYRQRRRFCKRCRRMFAADDAPRCPRCHAGRRDGWSFEAFPTNDVLAQHLRTRTNERWDKWRVMRLRTRAIRKLEAAMSKRELLTDDDRSLAHGA